MLLLHFPCPHFERKRAPLFLACAQNEDGSKPFIITFATPPLIISNFIGPGEQTDCHGTGAGMPWLVTYLTKFDQHPLSPVFDS